MLSTLIRLNMSKFLEGIMRNAWRVMLLSLALLYILSYIGFEMSGETEILDHFTYWFVVTTSTVGYGDYSPTTPAGEWIAIVTILFGIGNLALLISKIAEGAMKMQEKKAKGLGNYSSEEDHILIMGYRKGETETLIDEIYADKSRKDRAIILCSSHLSENPFMNHQVKFVKGELSSDDVMNRSAANKASRIIIHGEDDNQSFFTAFSVRQVNTSAHLIVYIRGNEHKQKVMRLPADNPKLNQVIQSLTVNLMVQEMQDPFSSEYIQKISSNKEKGGTIFYSQIPETLEREFVFGNLFISLRKSHNITLVGLQNGVTNEHPDMDEAVKPGMSVLFIGKERVEIPWDQL